MFISKETLTTYWHSLDFHSANQHRLTLGIIILSGFLLRLYTLYVGQAYTYFAINDEVTALQYALGLLAGDSHMYYLGSPALNQGNVPGPLWSLLVAVLYILGGSSAEGAIFGIIVLNTIAIYVVCRLASAFMPGRYAILSCLLFASSPWAIYYTAGLYNPVPLILLGALLFLNLWHTTQIDNTKAIFWVCILAAAIPQFHMIGIFYLPVILLMLFLGTAKINRRWFLLGSIVGMLLYMPYLIGDFLNDWQNTRAILGGDSAFSYGILKIITIPIAMLANHPGQWAGPSFDDFKVYADQYFGSYILLVLINLISIVLAATFIFSLLRKSWCKLRTESFQLVTCYRKYPAIFFIVILLFLPLLLYTLTGRAYTTRYSIMIFPLLYLLPAFFLMQYPMGRIKNTIVYSLLLLLCVNVYMVISFYHEQNARIQKGIVFMPSFFQLAKIKQSIDSAVHADTRIEFTYSDAVNALPEGQRKLYFTIEEYLRAFMRPLEKDNSYNIPVKLHILRADEPIQSDYLDKLVYASNAIKILNKSHTTH